MSRTKKPSRTRRLINSLLVAVMVATGSLAATLVHEVQTAPPAEAVQTPASCPAPVQLVNGGFEEPVIPASAKGNINFNQDSVNGWKTTASDGLIEYWADGFNRVPSREGKQFVELNANFASQLYQDVATTPGQAINWSLSHRGRQGIDTMRVLIGPPTPPGTPSALLEQQRFATGNTDWSDYSGTYVVPPGQTTTRFAFEAVSSAGGNSTLGNFLDNIKFESGPCIVLNKSVVNTNPDRGSLVLPGDTLEYTVRANNGGASPAANMIISDVIPTGTTFVPGSMRIETATITDAVDTDRGEFTGNTVRLRVGSGAGTTNGGTLFPTWSTYITFRVTVNNNVAAGTQIDNTATAVYTWARASLSSESNTTSNKVSTLGIRLSKTITGTTDSNANGKLDVGDRINYNFAVGNTGSETLSNLIINDPKIAGVRCSPNSVAAGGTVNCTGTYTVTQADFDAGQVQNSATATGTPPGGARAITSAASNVTQPLGAPRTGLQLTKTAQLQDSNGNQTADVGERINYTFALRNTGDVTVNTLKVTDPKLGAVTCPAGSLAPNVTVNCTGSYTVTQADVDAGTVNNSATASATAVRGGAVTSNTSSAVVPATATRSITIVKSAGALADSNRNGRPDVGESIPYTFVVTNTGSQTLREIAISDPKIGAVSCPTGSLAPNTPTQCSGTYQITQADIDAGQVVNTATGSAVGPAGQAVSGTSNTVTTPLTRVPELGLRKYVVGIDDTNNDGRNNAGDIIRYGFEVTNTGNVTVNGLSIVDQLPIEGLNCPAEALLPNRSANCFASYTITQNDIDQGTVDNRATARATGPNGSTAVSAESVTSTPVAGITAFVLTKRAGEPVDTNENGRIDAGETINYTFEVRNNGTNTLTGLRINDPKISNVSCPATTVLPNTAVTCTATYTFTQADINAGSVQNEATAFATPLNGQETSSNTSRVNVPLEQKSTLELVKTAGTFEDVDRNGQLDEGDRIPYTFTVNNSGNTTISALRVNDPKLGAVSCLVTSLEPGTSTTCNATYTVTQADVDSGAVNNSATVSGENPQGGTVTSRPSETTTPTSTAAELILDKSAGATQDANNSGRLDAGDTITYRFELFNNGSVTLHSLAINDPLVNPVTCPAVPLAPGQRAVCEATYTITQADMDAGTVDNNARGSSTAPAGNVVNSNFDTTTTPLSPETGLGLVKSAGGIQDTNNTERVDAGDTVEYTFEVTNTSTVTVDNLTITDPLIPGVSCLATRLTPKAVTTCTGTYTLTQADLNNGEVLNTAGARATSPNGSAVNGSDFTRIVVEQSPGLSLSKTAGTIQDVNESGTVDVGDVVPYTFEARNTGTTNLTAVTIRDPKIPSVSCTPTEIGPREVATCTGVYTLTQADIDAGQVENTAIANANPPQGDAIDSAEASATTTFKPKDSIAVVKSAADPVDANQSGRTDAGDTIVYSFRVTNTGGTTLTGISVNDPKVGAVSCPVSELPPGESTTCTATYTLTQDDLNAGQVENSATASGNPPQGRDAIGSTPSSITTELQTADSLSVLKSGSAPADTNNSGSVNAGDIITYTFTVENTGSRTVTSLSIADEKVPTVSCVATSLEPGDKTTCTGQYTLTQDDVDAGLVENTATANGLDPSGAEVKSGGSSETVEFDVVSSLAVDKQASGVADANESGRTDVGDTITYTFVVTNTGATTLGGVAINDSRVSGIACPGDQVRPGTKLTCTATYTLTQADLDAGTVENTATSSANPPQGDPVTSAPDSTSTILSVQ